MYLVVLDNHLQYVLAVEGLISHMLYHGQLGQYNKGCSEGHGQSMMPAHLEMTSHCT